MTKISADFAAWSSNLQRRVEARLEALLPDPKLAPQRLHRAMHYAVIGGSKRVRALLVFAAGEFADAPPERLLITASAIEMIHAYSLVHDDLPCMDDDALRRGKPSCHIEFDEPTALLVGDALQSLAFQVLAEHRLTTDGTTQLAMVQLLAAACGSRGMAGGQAIDLAAIGASLTLPELEFMHAQKTGALIRASILLGAECGTSLTSEHREKLERYAKCIGLAFQVIDDVLDAESSSETLGKTAGKDAANNKPTYVSVLGVPAARELAYGLRKGALDALAGWKMNALRLRQLAEFVVDRKF